MIGKYVKDTVTGIKGKIVARHQYMTGKVIYCVRYKSMGTYFSEWFDEARLIEVEE